MHKNNSIFRQKRRMLGLSQTELGLKIWPKMKDVNVKLTISRLERGIFRQLTKDEFDILCRELSITNLTYNDYCSDYSSRKTPVVQNSLIIRPEDLELILQNARLKEIIEDKISGECTEFRKYVSDYRKKS